MVRQFKREEHFVVAEAESSAWVSSWPLFGEFKNARRGLLLQPDQTDGDVILKTSLGARQACGLPRGPRRGRGRRQDPARAGGPRPRDGPRRSLSRRAVCPPKGGRDPVGSVRVGC